MVDRHVLIGAIVMLCVPIAIVANAEEPARSQEKAGRPAKIAWDSTTVQEMWELVQARVALPENMGKEQWYGRLDLFQDILKKKLPKEQLHILASSCATMPSGDDAKEFHGMLYETLLRLFMHNADREGLVRLFAAYFESDIPDDAAEGLLLACCGTERLLALTDTWRRGSVFRSDVERALAHGYDEARVVGKKDAMLVKSTVQWYEKHKHDRGMGAVMLTDPFLILTDAYSKSKTPAARKNIASALRRGLRGLGVGGKTDDEFIANAAKWYAQHKDHLSVNDSYGNGTDDEEQLFFLERSAGNGAYSDPRP